MNPTHNYLKELEKLRAGGALPSPEVPGVTVVSVAHDSFCGVFKGKRCNCSPTLKASQPNRAARRAAKK